MNTLHEDRACLKQWEEFQIVMGLDSNELDEKTLNEALKIVNQYLCDRTTLSGSHVTESDKLIFNSLYGQVQSMTYSEKEKYLNLSRWFSYVQTVSEVRGNRPKISFSRNMLY